MSNKPNSAFPNWRGHTCVIAGGGPSLTDMQMTMAQAAGAKLIVVNTTYQKASDPSAVYACDFLWWKQYHQHVFAKFGKCVPCWTQDRAAAERFNINYVRVDPRDGLSVEPRLRVGGNSGYGAINLAYLFGVRRMLLIGFDMREVDGQRHWHGDHPKPLVQTQQFGEWIKKFGKLATEAAAAGCEIINCTPGSALKCFPVSDLGEELAK